jgi:hypothetical protein
MSLWWSYPTTRAVHVLWSCSVTFTSAAPLITWWGTQQQQQQQQQPNNQ